MLPPPPPKGVRDVLDDPLLPFVVAAKAGDKGAERELLVRVAPTVVSVARAAGAGVEPTLSTVVLDGLISTLKALPTFRGEELVRETVARITLEKAKLSLGTLAADDDVILRTARSPQVRGRSGESSHIGDWVDRALQDDAAVLVSHVLLRTAHKRSKRRPYTWRGIAVIGLATVIGFWLLARLL
ncbi:MAG TPA: hypothetical protein VFQ35_08510 [Polyangiaceae bacterium]|nr:hypothetical protein [Polyangiaceae bacterium]